MVRTKGYQFVVAAGCLAALVLSLSACATTEVPKTAVPDGKDARLVKQPEDVYSTLSVPFSLASIPDKARFELAFRVDSKGICSGTSYRPTRITVNRKHAAELNFRDSYTIGQLVNYKFEAPPQALQVGDNTLRIYPGSCPAADNLRLNNLMLVQLPAADDDVTCLQSTTT